MAHPTEHGAAVCCHAQPSSNTLPAEENVDDLFVSHWQRPEERPILHLTHRVTRHDGVGFDLASLIGRPFAVTFAYSRCQNAKKCPLVTAMVAELRRKLEKTGLLTKVRLLLVTYDADWDTPEVLRKYSERYKLALDDHVMFLRPAPDPYHRLFRDLHVPVSFNPTGVTMHGIYMILIDKNGRLARSYRTIVWDNDRVLADLANLIDE